MGKLLRSAAFCGLMLVGLGQAEASTSTLYGSALLDGDALLVTIDPATGAIQGANTRFITGSGDNWPYAKDIAFAPEASAVPEPASWALLGAGFLGLAWVAMVRRGSVHPRGPLPGRRFRGAMPGMLQQAGRISPFTALRLGRAERSASLLTADSLTNKFRQYAPSSGNKVGFARVSLSRRFRPGLGNDKQAAGTLEMMKRWNGATGRRGRQNASLTPNWPRRAAMALGVLGFGVGGPLASPAIAGCLGHPEDNFCYIADVTINHNVEPAGSFVVIHSGATPQTAQTPMDTLEGSASASSDGAHNGTLEVRSEVDNDDYYFIQAEAYLSYTFQLSSTAGAPGDPLVPIRVTAFAESLRNTTTAQEKATVEIDQGSRLAYAEQKILSGREIDLLSLDQTIYVQPDTDILVTLYAESSVISGPGFGRASSGVFLDPTFEIDPAYASLYTLVGLPEAAAAAPEPATWAMVAVGFGLVGGLRRYRRRFAPTSLASANAE